MIERYTLMRGEGILDTPEKVILTPSPLKPHPLDDWQHIAQKDNYAAIIAQALYGDDFEVSGGEKDISQIIALSQEQEQRYAMSLFAAEMSYEAALFAGWGFEDKTAIQGERYLYRVIPVSPDTKKTVEMGSAYVGLDDYRELPRPLELDAIWGNGSVMVTWNSRLLEQYYTAYHLEKSEDGKTYRRISNTPLTNMMDGDRIFYTDSITNGKTYYYRVLGLTSFGEEGPLSDTIQGKGTSKLIYNPSILKAIPDENGKVHVTWDFNEQGNSHLTSFELRRGNTDKGPFQPVVSGISPESRTAVYEKPMPENYLVIAAIPKEGDEVVSFPYMLIMEDTIPPAIPVGLEGIVDTAGVVHLKWIANTDADILGYRIFRGQTEGEELIPLTDVAVITNEYSDTIDIYNLNAKVYYAVTALDKRYNQSELSEIAVLEKPDMIKPSAPFISKFESRERGVRLEWIPGREERLQGFYIYRAEKLDKESVTIHDIRNPLATTFLDSTVVGGTDYLYTIVSVNKTGITSDLSPEIAIKSKEAASGNKIDKFSARRTNNGISLKWQHKITGIRSVSIYRKEGESPYMLWKEAESWEREITDTTARRNTPYEYMLVIKTRTGIPIKAETKIDK
ncbi:fibronectin type III domain-containing protein [Dysgonomonas sp. 25]|uniref:fibronectin type III domain-containing protein n=1 Tax=Dysgonomonas sp. 25 TaxID=2302933 RepID=UPI0013D7FB26|nr:hypothetical protein [Dysgonomonas sp. 25]NDV70031.1 hypothetical protein [Dysgonomonas sp. 25]